MNRHQIFMIAKSIRKLGYVFGSALLLGVILECLFPSVYGKPLTYKWYQTLILITAWAILWLLPWDFIRNRITYWLLFGIFALINVFFMISLSLSVFGLFPLHLHDDHFILKFTTRTLLAVFILFNLWASLIIFKHTKRLPIKVE